ncbi:hypothetical protein FRC11_007958, partial [Ceratobasidium sp. 423]
MPRTQNFQHYDFASLQLVLGQDGLTYVMAPNGEIVHIVGWLPVPGGDHDKASIDRLVSEFRAGPGKGANKAVCSKCHDEGNYVDWDPKPASLK